MNHPSMKKSLAAALCTLTLGSTVALAEPDTFHLGRATRDDEDYKLLDNASATINEYARLAAPISQGNDRIAVNDCTMTGCFPDGALIMVLQMTGTGSQPETHVGRWELARVHNVVGTTVTLTAPLIHDHAAGATQVIWVREYKNVTLGMGSTLQARAWDGNVGGVVAFLASGLVTNHGTITASGMGFRGGELFKGSGTALPCPAAGRSVSTGAPSGEGIVHGPSGSTRIGGGATLNGAGGGVCNRFGGGGGGNGGAGGMGGGAQGGMGGAALELKEHGLIDRLLLGGGGGAGNGTRGSSKLEDEATGSGGGIVFIRGNMLTGDGFISAAGAPGRTNDGHDTESSGGASGGGAGGSIYLRFAGAASCGEKRFNVSGGTGGSTNYAQVGSGGGGGGGQMLFQAAEGGTCQPELDEEITLRGEAGAVKSSELKGKDGLAGGFDRLAAVTPPSVASPGKEGSTNNPRPVIQGETKEPNATVIVFIDGKEVGRTPRTDRGDYSFPLPPALPDLLDGSYEVEVVNEVDGMRSPKSPAVTFTVDTTPPDAKILTPPTSTSRETSTTLEFTHEGMEPGPVKYKCKLDTEKDFTDCTGPKTYTDLPEGEHTFQVKAIDEAGNEDPSPATYTWTVDTTPPDSSIGISDVAFRGNGFGCSATGGGSTLVLMGLGSFLALARRRRRN